MIKKSKKGLAPFSLGYIASGELGQDGRYIFHMDGGETITLSPIESAELRWDTLVRQISPELIRVENPEIPYIILANTKETARLKKELGLIKPKGRDWAKKPTPDTFPLFK
ncbi:MAG: hypothetical protein HGA67_03755 [Candidatus Yonathbacteria bacterium]|nr:hypothetical protein [Candidatus Yonathbacteria bacterium]